jgi:hypothetical protein
MNFVLLKRWFFIVAVLGALGACATSPYQGQAKVRSDDMLRAQIKQATEQMAVSKEARVIYAGFAMHSQSKAFRNDVLSGARLARALDPRAIVFQLDNPAFGQNDDWPFATAENIRDVITQIAKLARDGDRVMLLFSTHGNVDVLGVNVAATNHPYVNGRALRSWLAPLGNKPTLLILSACYSGSFLDPLKAPNRMILTAAAKDRSSFGCQFHSDNTFFVQELIPQRLDAQQSLNQMADAAAANVAKREEAMRLSPPSLPQRFVGSGFEALAQLPLAQWLGPIKP